MNACSPPFLLPSLISLVDTYADVLADRVVQTSTREKTNAGRGKKKTNLWSITASHFPDPAFASARFLRTRLHHPSPSRLAALLRPRTLPTRYPRVAPVLQSCCKAAAKLLISVGPARGVDAQRAKTGLITTAARRTRQHAVLLQGLSEQRSGWRSRQVQKTLASQRRCPAATTETSLGRRMAAQNGRAGGNPGIAARMHARGEIQR